MKKVSMPMLTRIGRELIQALGENPDDPRLSNTPTRFAKAWREFIEYDPGVLNTAFDTTTIDQVVVVSGIRVWSMCEHHLLPFSATIAIGYLPNKKILGLSKFARIAHYCSHRLQVQERLVQDIAELVMKYTDSKDVAVLAQGQHLCMSTRGVRTEATMTSQALFGIFRDEPDSRAEFMNIVKLSGKT